MHADCVRRKTFNGLAGTFGYVGGIWLSGALGVAWQVLAASLLTSFRRLVRYVSPMCLSCKPNQRSFTMKLFFAQFFLQYLYNRISVNKLRMFNDFSLFVFKHQWQFEYFFMYNKLCFIRYTNVNTVKRLKKFLTN